MVELESLVERMENGEQSLEDSLKDFERGIALTRSCQKSLQETEQKIQMLIEKNGQDELVDFDEEWIKKIKISGRMNQIKIESAEEWIKETYK